MRGAGDGLQHGLSIVAWSGFAGRCRHNAAASDVAVESELHADADGSGPARKQLVTLQVAVDGYLHEGIELDVLAQAATDAGAEVGHRTFGVGGIGQRALVGALEACNMDGGRAFAGTFAWLLAVIYLASAASRLRLQAGLIRLEAGDRPQADENIARVPLPASDPVTGKEEGLVRIWAD